MFFWLAGMVATFLCIDTVHWGIRSFSCELKLKMRINMTRKSVLYSVRIGVITVGFAAGYLSGSMTQHNANAGVADYGWA